MKMIYGGDSPTIHPSLGQLVPGENEIPDRRLEEATRAAAAGLPLTPVLEETPARGRARARKEE